MGLSQKCSNSCHQVGWGLHHLSPVGFWLNALRILSGAFQLRVSPPLGWERSHVSPAYSGSGTSHTYPQTYPGSGCGCGGISIECHLLHNSAYQYSPPTYGKPPTPTSESTWPPRGLHHVGSFSLGTGSRILFGGCGSPLWPSSNMAVLSCLHKWILREDRISWMASSI